MITKFSETNNVGKKNNKFKSNINSIFSKLLLTERFKCFLILNLKKISSLSKRGIKVLFNNLVTNSVFLATPPNSFSKLSIFSWLINQCQESTFSLVAISLILAEIFMLVAAFLGFLFVYTVYKKDTFFINEVLPYFKKLSPLRKLIIW